MGLVAAAAAAACAGGYAWSAKTDAAPAAAGKAKLPRVFFEVKIGPTHGGRVVFEVGRAP